MRYNVTLLAALLSTSALVHAASPDAVIRPLMQ